MPAGYDGHLSSHGIAYRPRWDQLHQLMSGSDDWRSHARGLGIRHIFWGDREQAAYPESTQPWRADSTQVANGAWGSLWELTAVSSADPSAAAKP